MQTRIRTMVAVLLFVMTGCDTMSVVRGECSPAPLIHRAEISKAHVCVNANLSDVAEVPRDAEWIEFTVSRINDLPSDSFASFTKLRRLTFYNCEVRRVNDEAFRGLDRLEWLVVSNTRIEAARAAHFRHLKNLRRLTLDGAGLVYVEPELFNGLRKLETLSLRDNDLDCLPIEAIGALGSLKSVQIGENPWLCDCRDSMEELFAARSIDHGPSDRRESVAARNDSVRRLRPDNKIRDCMAVLDYPELPQLESQDLEITPPPPRQGLRRFEWRQSVGNEGIESLDKLPDEITWIQMFEVALPILKRYTFFRFGNTLRSVELRNCAVERIERESFAGLHKLERLSLLGNHLFTVGHEWFRDLARLTHLVLRRNEIENMDENALIHLGNLRVLDLTRNRLACLSGHHLRGLVSLEKVQATDNPWLCRCRTDLQNYFIATRIGYQMNSGRCGLPPENITSDKPRYNDRTSRTSPIASGMIRWSWAYEIHDSRRPSIPVPIRLPPVSHRPPARPGGCRLVRRTDRRRRYAPTTIESCACTRASLLDLTDLPANLEAILYSGSVIPTIRNETFRKFGPYLKRLELRDCGLRNIEPRAFSNLGILETLVVRGNDLDLVESEWFQDTINIRSLDLSANRITRISNGLFDKLPYLVALDVSDNRLNCIGIEHLEALDYLRQFEITGNPWTCLCITKLLQLIKDNDIACECNTDAALPRTEDGWACEAGARYYPITGASPPVILTTTTTTTRPYSPILQPNITDPPRTWPISGTCYQTEEERTTTTAAAVQQNQDEVGKRANWGYHCANGDIDLLNKIPSNITRIEITDSYVPRLTSMAFARFDNLTELVLKNSTLRDIDDRAFAALYKLAKLTLRDNRLIAVKKNWFDETRNLVWLDLSDNYLTEIEDGALDPLDKLEYLNLEGNAFKCLYTSCFVALPRLRTLEFGRNPLKWRCWQELGQFLEIRAIGYTYHKCPHSGKDLVRNLLKDDKAPRLVNAAAAGGGGGGGGGTALVVFASTTIFLLIPSISSWLV